MRTDKICQEIATHLKAKGIPGVRSVRTIREFPEASEEYPLVGPMWKSAEFDVNHGRRDLSTGAKAFSAVDVVDVLILLGEGDQLAAQERLEQIVFSDFATDGVDGVLERLLSFQSSLYLLTPTSAELIDKREFPDARFSRGMKVRCQVQRIR